MKINRNNYVSRCRELIQANDDSNPDRELNKREGMIHRCTKQTVKLEQVDTYEGKVNKPLMLGYPYYC